MKNMLIVIALLCAQTLLASEVCKISSDDTVAASGTVALKVEAICTSATDSKVLATKTYAYSQANENKVEAEALKLKLQLIQGLTDKGYNAVSESLLILK